MTVAQSESSLQEALGARDADIVVVYDGQCVFCNSYIKLMRLRASAGNVVLCDAREDDAAQRVKDSLGLDLDEGMLVLYGGRAYYGADAMHILSSLTSRSNAWNGLTASIFSRHWLARVLYPFLKLGRSLALLVLGRPRIRTSA
ncbi:MAG: DUF393 domain-containing protein [Hyphomicrobiales bacterium]|nr:DUF393 domain-containing protein [Hyphomicrobiales bacterium]